MSVKTRSAKPRTARATARGDTATYQQPEGSTRASAENRKVEKMPHERDQSASDTGNRLDQAVPPTEREMTQAHDDVESGLQDTDRRGVPDDIPDSRENRGR
jgi:hypothetical protein